MENNQTIKASELRIDNLVNYLGKNIVCNAQTIYAISLVVQPSVMYLPIPLTEEWLLRMGFEKVHESKTWEEVKISFIDGEYMYWISGMYYLTQNGNWWSFYHSSDEDTYYQIHYNVQYVHQLQNLYYALTNQELEIKES